MRPNKILGKRAQREPSSDDSFSKLEGEEKYRYGMRLLKEVQEAEGREYKLFPTKEEQAAWRGRPVPKFPTKEEQAAWRGRPVPKEPAASTVPDASEQEYIRQRRREYYLNKNR